MKDLKNLDKAGDMLGSLTGFVNMASNGDPKTAKVMGIVNSAAEIGKGIIGAKLPKMRKGGKMTKKGNKSC